MVNEEFIFQTGAPAAAFGLARGGDSPCSAGDRNGAANRFLSQFEGTLRRLCANRLRFSVMRLVLPIEAAGGAAPVAWHLADPYVLAGIWRDESVIAVFFGPRSHGGIGDGLQARKIEQHCRRAMSEAGQADLVPLSRLLIAHCWTDEVADPAALIEALAAPCGRDT